MCHVIKDITCFFMGQSLFIRSVFRKSLININTCHHTPIHKHHIYISFVFPPVKYVNNTDYSITMQFPQFYITIICTNTFSISIIHADYNMHILLLPARRRKGKNPLPVPAPDLTAFCKFPDWYLI